MSYSRGSERGPTERPPLRVPHVLLDAEEVRTAVKDALSFPEFVFDVETKDGEHARTNHLTWVGFGTPNRSYLIPTAHERGVMITPERKVEKTAWEFYGPADERAYTTVTKKPSMKKVQVIIPATYAPMPRQLPADQVCELVQPLLWSDRAKVGHNIKFDLQTIAKYFDHEIPPGPYHDTIILRHVCDENETNYGLKELMVKWMEPRDPKKWYPNLGKQGVHRFPLNKAASYLNKDLRYCWMMFKRWLQRLHKSPALTTVYEFEMSLYPLIMDLEYTGFPVDLSGLEEVRRTLEADIARIEGECYDLVGGQFELSNTNVKRWILFGECNGTVKKAFGIDASTGRSTFKVLQTQGLKPLSVTPVEKLPQITQGVLEFYADRNELARLLLEWSTYEKLRGTFVEGLSGLLQDHGGPLPTLHTSLKQHGTVTGRFSAEKPNLHQLPRGTVIRKLFVAGPGNVLIVADYDQIELRCLAQQAEERMMVRIFQEGRDIHREAAAAAMKIAVEDVTEDMRQRVGKVLNFATGYGAGPDRIAAVAGVSKRRGQQFLNRYYDQFSGLQPWKARVLDEARNDLKGYVVIPPFGRRRRLGAELFNYREDEHWIRSRAERQAINAIIQGFASYITKMAMRDLYPKLAEFPAKMVLQVHDEIIVRVAESHLDEVLPLVVDTMSDVKALDGGPILGKVPLIVSAKAGYTWASAKGK